jgi:hypothetical protein
VYAHQAKYHGFFVYDLDSLKWNPTSLTGMPFYGWNGRKKKSKDGGSADFYDGRIFAIKGGNTQQFWCYFPGRDSWFELDTLPAYGSAGRKKRVKYGADLVYAGYAFWTLKGNKTLEMWRYGIPLGDQPLGGTKPVRSGVAGSVKQRVKGWGFSVVPNPLAATGGVLRYSVPVATRLTAKLYDAAGREVRTLVPGTQVYGSGAIRLDTEGIAAGVYLVDLQAGAERKQNFKLVVR